MTFAQEKAFRFRHLILIVGSVFTLAGLTYAFLPIFFEAHLGVGILGTVLALNPVASRGALPYAVNAVTVTGIIILLQWAFLRPGTNWRVRLTTHGIPLKSSVISAGVMAMLLTTGMISLLLELPDWWQPLMDSDSLLVLISIYGTMLVIWGVWGWIFFIYWRQGDRYTQMGRMIHGLVAGSILEIMVAVPVHIWAARQRECYCCRGTYTTIVLAGTVLIWAFGPSIILLYMREKYRREKLITDRTASEEK
jgi:hypothetical protein